MAVKPVPDGYHAITPYLIIKGAAKAIDYYKQALGATEIMRMDDKGRIGHAELKIGDSMFMLADEYPEMGYLGPEARGGTPVSLMLYVPDVDATFNRSVSAGAKVVKAVEDQFYGDRSGTITDPFGHQWTISTHKEDVSPEQMKERMAEMAQK